MSDPTGRDFIDRHMDAADLTGAAISQSLSELGTIISQLAGAASKALADWDEAHEVGTGSRIGDVTGVGSTLAETMASLAEPLGRTVETYAASVSSYEADVDMVFDRLRFLPDSTDPWELEMSSKIYRIEFLATVTVGTVKTLYALATGLDDLAEKFPLLASPAQQVARSSAALAEAAGPLLRLGERARLLMAGHTS
jgi:hypothetical protein